MTSLRALILKGIWLQTYWVLAVYYGPLINDIFFLIASIITLVLNLYLFKPTTKVALYFLFALCFSIYGLIQDGLLTLFDIMNFKEGHYPFWANSLYLVFIAYYGDIFNYLNKLKLHYLSLIGGLGGLLAYYCVLKLESIDSTNRLLLLTIVFGSWAFFFPASLNLYQRIFEKK